MIRRLTLDPKEDANTWELCGKQRWMHIKRTCIRTDKGAQEPRGACIGVTNTPTGPSIHPLSFRNREIILACRRLLDSHDVTKDFHFTSIQVRIGGHCEEHVDGNNEGPLIMLANRDFEGGQFVAGGS